MSDDIYSGDLTHNPEFMQYLRNATSRSGTVPSASMLDQIIQAELHKASSDMFRQKQLQLQRKGLEEGKREFDIALQQKEDDRTMASATGLIGAAANLGTMYALGRRWKNPYILE